MSDFQSFSKIPRLNRDIVITEKIDGTNAQILIEETAEGIKVVAGSRNRWISVDKDNFGFARWVETCADVLVDVLGPGRHFGEWWGPGIQRGYGLGEKRFSLFNTHKWGWLADPVARQARIIPVQLHVVPVLYEGPWFVYNGVDHDWAPYAAMESLRKNGSAASPGFMRPEGIVVYHTAGGHMYKATLEGDDKPKGEQCRESL